MGAIRDSPNVAVFEPFIARYKNTSYAELARARAVFHNSDYESVNEC
jgi:hypothetical protein